MTDSEPTPPPEKPAATVPAANVSRRGFSVWWAVGLAFVAFVGLIAIFSGGSDTASNASGLEEFEFQTADGGTTTLAEFDGEPLVVNYFAAWCPPCRAELPDFEAVHREMGEEVTFVGVSRDNVTDAWLTLIADTGVTYTTVFEGNVQGSFAFLDARAMPTTVFIAADGTVKQVWSGLLDDGTLRDLINEHLLDQADL